MDFSVPWSALFGGMLLGLSATLLLLINGKVAGISGVLSRLLTSKSGDILWRLLFLVGLVLGGLSAAYFTDAPKPEMIVDTPLILLAGLLVGLGSKIGNGCTSGHGICGIGRLSTRSIVATLTFMSVGVITTFIIRHIF